MGVSKLGPASLEQCGGRVSGLILKAARFPASYALAGLIGHIVGWPVLVIVGGSFVVILGLIAISALVALFGARERQGIALELVALLLDRRSHRAGCCRPGGRNEGHIPR